jgi:transposase InsO family protein
MAPYRSHLHRQTCVELGIRHGGTRAHTPRTKARPSQTLTERSADARLYGSSAGRTAALPSWLGFYHHQRPPSALARQTPAARLAWLLENNVMAGHS